MGDVTTSRQAIEQMSMLELMDCHRSYLVQPVEAMQLCVCAQYIIKTLSHISINHTFKKFLLLRVGQRLHKHSTPLENIPKGGLQRINYNSHCLHMFVMYCVNKRANMYVVKIFFPICPERHATAVLQLTY